jgi:hypothetical protein
MHSSLFGRNQKRVKERLSHRRTIISRVSSKDARCGFLPHPDIHKKHVICRVIDCGKATDGKQYCVKLMNIDERRKLPTDMRATIRSSCCGAKCTVGEAHEYGEQYCSKCKQACAWTKAL